MSEEDAEYHVRLYTPCIIDNVRHHTSAAQLSSLARVQFGAVVTHMSEEKKKEEERRGRAGRKRDRKRHGRKQPQQ